MNYIKCPICFDIFSNTKVPNVLPCGHTICSDCFLHIQTECKNDTMHYTSSESEESSSDFSFVSDSKKGKKKQSPEENFTIVNRPVESKEEEYEDKVAEEDLNSEGYESVSEDDDNNAEAEEEEKEEESEEESEEEEEEDEDDCNVIIDNEENVNRKENKFKFKCPYCSQRIKISNSKIVVNTSILKYNNDITKEAQCQKIFCKICGVTDTLESHLQKYSTFHNNYCVSLTDDNLTKLKASLHSIDIKDNTEKCASFLSRVIKEIFNKKELLKSVQNSFTKKLEESLFTTQIKQKVNSKFQELYTEYKTCLSAKVNIENIESLRNEFKKLKFLELEYTTSFSSEVCLEKAEDILNKAEKLVSKYKSIFYFTKIKITSTNKRYENMLAILKYLFKEILISILADNFSHSLITNTIYNENKQILIYENDKKKYKIYNAMFNREIGISLPTNKISFNIKSQELDQEKDIIYFFGKKKKQSQEFLSYDFISHTVTFLPKIPIPFYQCDTLIYKNKLYIIGGKSAKYSYSTKCFVFDLSTQKWSTLPDLQLHKTKKTILCTNNIIYALGGKGTEISLSYTFEKFNLNDANAKWETFSIENYYEPLCNFAYWLYDESTLIIIGGENRIIEDYESNGYLIDLSNEKLITSFAIKGIFVNKYGTAKNYRGRLMVADKEIDNVDQFDIWHQLEKIKIII